MNFGKVHFVPIVLGLIIAFLSMSILELYQEWRRGYIVFDQRILAPTNLLADQWGNMRHAIRPLITSKHGGLPKVHLYISQRARAQLTYNLPAQVKKWQKGFLLYPNGRLRQVKVRHRGDAPEGWGFNKKAWRIKTRKSRLLNNQRVFNYIIPESAGYLEDYLVFYIAQKSNIPTSNARLVEIWLNDKPQGIYLELEQMDESFLRHRNIMPVNIYKGEQFHAERKMILDFDLFSNPALWSKVARFNQRPEEDKSDLITVLNLIRQAETSNRKFQHLTQVAPSEAWAHFSAYQTLVQAWNNDDRHNQRIISDPWKGTVTPIMHDAWYNIVPHARTLDDAHHPLLALYHQSSPFLLAKYRHLYQMVQDRVLDQTVQHTQKLIPQLRRSLERTPHRYQELSTHGASLQFLSDDHTQALWQQLINHVEAHQEWLHHTLTQPPKAHWHNTQGKLLLLIDGYLPLNQVTLTLKNDTPIPHTIFWDKNSNGILDEANGDLVIPFSINGKKITLNATWLANRVATNPIRQNRITDISNVQERITPTKTQFHILSTTPLHVASVSANNALTQVPTALTAKTGSGNTPLPLNHPIIPEQEKPQKIWQDRIEITKTTIIHDPVKILAGTKIIMAPNTSLVFKNRLEVNGSAQSPVTVTPATKTWGTFALHGQKTAGSRIHHLKIQGGSGEQIGLVHYIGMLSLHDTKDIVLNHLTLKDNKKFDDMMHVIYSEEITLDHCLLKNARSDALDVDISNVMIKNCHFINAGNDAVDLMSSKAAIVNSHLEKSGDKGVSVGEASRALIFNSRLHKNNIGVEAKDRSLAQIVQSDLINNKIAVHAYKKNWRYGSGGHARLDKVIIKDSKETSLMAKKRSKIEVFNSFVALPKSKRKRIHWDQATEKSIQQSMPPSPLQQRQKTSNALLTLWGLHKENKSLQRGAPSHE
ncbi:CotH kinase family protein [Magnetococcales bacterium HHB-1]